MKRIFSGAQPAGSIRPGNYPGALPHRAEFRHEHESLPRIVNLHANASGSITRFDVDGSVRRKSERAVTDMMKSRRRLADARARGDLRWQRMS